MEPGNEKHRGKTINVHDKPEPEAKKVKKEVAAVSDSGSNSSKEGGRVTRQSSKREARKAAGEPEEPLRDRSASSLSCDQKRPRPDGDGSHRRRGKWTAPEETYASLIIDHFISGKAPGCSGGESLRALLADLLRCTPMRITKKFSRTRMIGKSCFKKAGALDARELAEFEAARRAFAVQAAADGDDGSHATAKRARADALAEQNDWLTQGCDPSAWCFDADVDTSLHGGELDELEPPPAPPPTPHDKTLDAYERTSRRLSDLEKMYERGEVSSDVFARAIADTDSMF